MDQNRKKVILNEIMFWKQNKMLPEQYCNYLLALYSEGNEEQVKPKTRKLPLNSENLYNLLFLFIMIMMIVITYITDISFGMQTLILSILSVVLLLSFIFYRKKAKNRLLIYITAAFLLLLYSVQINDAFLHGDTFSLYILLLVNSIIWVVGGVWRKKSFFMIAGVIATIILIFLLIK